MYKPIVALFLLAACGTVDRDDSTLDPSPRDAGAALRDGGADLADSGPRDGGAPATTTCPPGAPSAFYSLYAIDPLPPKSEIDLPHIPDFAQVVSAEDDQVALLRIEVCTPPDASPVLSSILYGGTNFGAAVRWVRDDSVTVPTESFVQLPIGDLFEIRVPSSFLEVEGLAAALGGDTDDLVVRVRGQGGLMLVGHPTFVAAARGNVTADDIDYSDVYITVGRLEAGDVFDALVCPLSQWFRSETFDLGTAHFEVDACFYLGGGHTEGYTIQRLAIEDDNPALAEADRVPHEFVGTEAVEAVLNYRWNHHNACDSFHLALPHADYAASTGPRAGCGATVPNAPERQFDEPSNSPVKYRLRYGDGEWTEGEITGCWHYLFCE